MKNKEKIIISIEWFQLISLIILPIFLLRKGASIRNITHPLIILTFVKIILEKKIHDLKKYKFLYIGILTLIIIILLNMSYFNLFKYKFAVSQLKDTLAGFTMLFMVTQIKIKEKYIPYKNNIIDIAYFIFIVNFLIKWKKMNYPLTIRFTTSFFIFTFSAICAIGFIYYSFNILYKEKTIKTKMKDLLFSIFLIFGVIINNSRMSIISTLLILLIMLGSKIITSKFIKVKIILVFILLFGGLFLVNSNSFITRMKTLESPLKKGDNLLRIEIWKNAIFGIKNKPLLGNGYSNYIRLIKEKKELNKNNHYKPNRLENYSYTFEHSHNNYLECWMGIGIFGLISLLFINLEIIKILYKNYKKYKYNSTLIGLTIFLYVFLISLTDTVIGIRRINELAYYFIGIGMMEWGKNEKKI